MNRPLVVEIFAGTFGWSAGWLARGGASIGFDIEHLPHHGPIPKNAELVLQDVRTLHGSQFKDAALILASPPCQEFSYRAMPWKRAKALGPPLLGMELFASCFRLQREASAAAGHHIPMVVENVRGAQKYVGRAPWHFGSYYLWGDVPALMPFTARTVMKRGVAHRSNGETNFHGSAQRAADGEKNPGFRFDGSGKSFQSESVNRHTKNTGGSWFNIGSPGQKVVNQNPVHEAVKGVGIGSSSWQAKEDRHPNDPRNFGSKSSARKAASALIARIPDRLSDWIAEVYFPPRTAHRRARNDDALADR